MKRVLSSLAALMLVIVMAGSARAAEVFSLDRSHSEVGFTVTHMMISKVRGNFGDFAVDLTVDAKDLSKSSVKAVIQAASVDTDNEKRDEHLRGADFFDVAKFKTLTFTSKKIEKRGAQWVAIGDFTMHGVTKTIELPFTFNGPIQDPWGNTRIGIEATLVLNRQDYGVSYGSGMVGDEVSILITLEATKK
ncbi:MAG: YceI family protein [Candidatus Delongbacteria bacterium]